MRRVLALALPLLAAPCAAGPSQAATPARWIVALAPAADARRVAVMDRSEPFVTRLARHGLSVVARLGEAGPRHDAALPWTLDRSRIVLVEGGDGAWPPELENDPAIAWWEPELEREPCVWVVGAARALHAAAGGALPDLFPDDPLYRDGRQWGLGAGGVRARSAWAVSTGHDSVLLAVCDTGVDPAHPDLAGVLRDGSPRLVEGVDVTTSGASFADSVAHGTLVAGVMAARTNDGAHFDSLGIAGVCGGDGATTAGCRLAPIKITPGSRGGAGSFAIARGILHAASAGARAINLSFAGSGPSRTERLALLDALARGAVVVCAAGNLGVRAGSAPMWPAAHAADGLCVQVGAHDAMGERCAFSSHGPGLDVLAPGLDVWTTYMTYPSAAGWSAPGYVAASGTSFAAPFATGTIGLLAAARPDLAPEDFQHVLRHSARDAGAPGPDSFTGFGLLDAAAALDLVGPRVAIAHVEVAPSFVSIALDTLVVADRGIPLLDSLGRRAYAERWRLRARVAVPDSLGDSSRAWVRVSGTTTTRADWRVPYLTPWAGVRRVAPRAFEVEGVVFRIVDARADRLAAWDDPARWIPAPPARARVGMTLIGERREGAASPPASAVSAMLRATPNPFRDRLRIAGTPGATAYVYDLQGRRIAVVALGAATGMGEWNGLSHRGGPVAPGLYWLTVAGSTTVRIVRTR